MSEIADDDIGVEADHGIRPIFSDLQQAHHRLTGRGLTHPNLRDLYRAVIEKLQSQAL